MTMYGFLATLVWAGLAFWVWRGASPFLGRYLSLLEGRQVLATAETGERLHGLRAEREAAAAERAEKANAVSTPDRQNTPIPDDLEAFVMDESERWRQDELRADIRARFIQYGEWNKVRRAVGIGAMDEVPT